MFNTNLRLSELEFEQCVEEQSEICPKGNGQEILQTQYTCTRKVKKIVRQIASIKGEWAGHVTALQITDKL